MKFLSLEQDTFSLQISDSSVKIVKLGKIGKNFSVCSFNEIEIKPGIVEGGVIKNEKDLVSAIKMVCEKVKGKKIKTKHVLVSLPEEESFLQVMQMPKMSEDELGSAIVFEAENYIPMPIDKVYFDFQIIAPVAGEIDHLDVLIVAMSKKIVDSYVSCVKKAGLIPVAMEAESQATARALIKKETTNHPVIIVDLNDEDPSFIIFSGSCARFTTSASVLTSGQSFAVQKSKSKRRLVKERLIFQIEKYIDFYKEHASHEHIPNEGNIKKIILCGPEADLLGLVDFISEKTGIETEIGNPFINFSRRGGKYIRITDPLRYATTLGLALKKF